MKGRARRPGSRGFSFLKISWLRSMYRAPDMMPDSTGDTNQEATVGRKTCWLVIITETLAAWQVKYIIFHTWLK